MRKKKGVYITMRRVNRVVSAAVALCMAATMVAPVWAASEEPSAKASNGVVYELLDRAPMQESATASSEKKPTEWHDGVAGMAFDGTTAEAWSTAYTGAPQPHWIKWDLTADGTDVLIGKLVYKWKDGWKAGEGLYSGNGKWKNIEVYTYLDGVENRVNEFTLNNSNQVQEIVFDQPVMADAMKVVINHCYAELSNKDGIASAGEIEVYKAEKTVTLKGASLTLDGNIGVNFYYDLPASVLADPNVKVVITAPAEDVAEGTKEIVFDAEKIKAALVPEGKQGAGWYKFTAPVTARQMQDQVSIKVVSGEKVLAQSQNYTVRKNADELLRANSDAMLCKLVRNMLNYGSKMQSYKNYNMANLADKDLNGEAMQTVKQEANSVTAENFNAYAPELEGTLPAELTDAGLSLMLKSNTTVRVYFNGTPAEGTTFTLDNVAVTPVQNGNQCYVETAGIGAKELSKEHTLVVSNGTATKTYTFSALSYGQIVRKNHNSGALKDLVCAMYKYNEVATAYATPAVK